MSDWTELVLVIPCDEETGKMPSDDILSELQVRLENLRWEQLNPGTFKQSVYKDHIQTVLDKAGDLASMYGVEFWVYHSHKLAILT